MNQHLVIKDKNYHIDLDFLFYIIIASIFICSSTLCFRCISNITYNLNNNNNNNNNNIDEIINNNIDNDINDYSNYSDLEEGRNSNSKQYDDDDDSSDLPTYNEVCKDN